MHERMIEQRFEVTEAKVHAEKRLLFEIIKKTAGVRRTKGH